MHQPLRAVPTPRAGLRAAHPPALRRVARTSLLLTLVLVSAWVPLARMDAPSLVPMSWPAAGLLAGMHLTSPRGWRRWLLPLAGLLVLLAHVVHGLPLLVSLGHSLGTLVAALLARALLVRGLGERRAALLDQGDVSRMIGAITVGASAAGLVAVGTARLTGVGDPALAGVATFGTHAAAMMVLLPLFMETLSFAPLAGLRERLLQMVITLGTTVAVFAFDSAPLVVFAVMPMFAWHAFRGTLREATLLLTATGFVGAGFSVYGIGPIHRLGELYGLSPELASGVLQLFLLDCGLILLPLSVMVTQQRIAANRAVAERTTLERVVDAARDMAVVATDRDGRITLFNPGAETVFGCPASAALGQLPDRFFTVAELERQAGALGGVPPDFGEICAAVVEGGDGQRLWQLAGDLDEERTLRMSVSAIRDGDGTTGYLVTAEDVTAREAAHRALLTTLRHERLAAERLRELERVKGDFVATVSHELRTPITSIVGYTELLEDGAVGELTAAQLEMVARVDRNGRRLLALVEDLLTLSEVETSRLTIEKVSTDLRSVVAGAYDAVSATLEGRHLDVVVDLPGAPLVQQGDPLQLQRMVQALLSNAVKFTPDDGRVEVVLRDRAEHCEIVVRDSGMGIAEEEQERLFTRFFRSHAASREEIQGAGLGLTIVQAIVTLHGGEVRVASSEGQGTAVTVVLPRTVAVPQQRPHLEAV